MVSKAAHASDELDSRDAAHAAACPSIASSANRSGSTREELQRRTQEAWDKGSA
jgi:hypothetical protein